MSWKYTGTFLDQFENRNFITQRVVEAYRGLSNVYLTEPDDRKRPAKNVTEMQARMERDIDDRIARDWEEHKADLAKLLEVLTDDETVAFCRFIAKREGYTPEQKQTEKRKAAQDYINAAMRKQEPTEKQLAYLARMGCDRIPANKHEASVLIEGYKNPSRTLPSVVDYEKLVF